MKIKSFLFYGFTALAGILSSCSNEDDTQPDNSQTDGKSFITVSFTMPSEGGEPATPQHAIVSIWSGDADPVYADEKVSISPSAGGFRTGSLEVDFGSYKLVKFIVYDEEEQVILAAPFEGSAKAGTLADVLPIDVTVCCDVPTLLPADVLQVTGGADAPLFGYAEGAFGIDSTNACVPVRFRSEMTIGTAFYDSLNSLVKVTAWDNEENYWWAERSLDGVTLITVPLYYDHYKVEWTQWGSNYEISLDREKLYSGDVLVLSASRNPRILASETEYRWLAEGYRLESRTDYIYEADGKLIRQRFFQKQSDSDELSLRMETFYEYEAGRLKRLRKVFDGQLLEQQLYHYLEDGRLKAIDLDGGGGSQIVEWIYDAQTGEFRGVQYSFENNHSFVYNYLIKSGNVVAETYGGGTNAGGGSSNISYDRFINPYYQFNITDYFLRYSSRNNVNGKISSYTGSFPTYVPKVITTARTVTRLSGR